MLQLCLLGQGNYVLIRVLGSCYNQLEQDSISRKKNIRKYTVDSHGKHGDPRLKYIEFGIGNRWLVRTEIEHPDGTEAEVRGVVRPVKFRSLYVRIWLRKKVWIIDSQEGFKKTLKSDPRFKIILGIRSEL